MTETMTNPRLLPRIKVAHAAEASADAAIAVPEAEAPLVVPLSADLVLSLMLDKGGHYELLKAGFRDLNPNLSDDDIVKIAVSGLHAEVGQNIKLQGQPGFVVMATCGGNFEASLIIYTPLWDTVHQHFAGDVVIGIPTPDMLLIGDATNPDAIAEVRAGIERVLGNEQPSVTSPSLYRKSPESSELTNY